MTAPASKRARSEAEVEKMAERLRRVHYGRCIGPDKTLVTVARFVLSLLRAERRKAAKLADAVLDEMGFADMRDGARERVERAIMGDE